MKKLLNWWNRNKILKSRVAQLEKTLNIKNQIIVMAADKLVQAEANFVKFKLQHELKKTEKVGHN